MKKITCFGFLVISFHCLYSQSTCQKGTWIFGLSPLKYTFAQKEITTSYISDTIQSKNNSSIKGIAVGYDIGGGYFVANNLCIGAGFGLSSNGLGVVSSPAIPTELFVRYYLLQKRHCYSFQKENKMMSRSTLFAQGTLTGGYSNMDYNNKGIRPPSNNGIQITKNKYYQYGAYMAIGYTYLVRKHFAIEAEINSFYLAVTNTQTGTFSINGNSNQTLKSKSVNNSYGCYISLGFQTYF